MDEVLPFFNLQTMIFYKYRFLEANTVKVIYQYIMSISVSRKRKCVYIERI